MLKINQSHIEDIITATKVEDLYPLLQNAIELEHATIPPYLTAMFSLRPVDPLVPTPSDATRKKVWNLIHSVVIEEMLHLTIVANIINAFGGSPAINQAAFVPEYPSPLPMGIENNLTVKLKKYSREQVHDTFMVIEKPEGVQQIHYNDLRKIYKKEGIKKVRAFLSKGQITIGLFYHLLEGAIQNLTPEALAKNSHNARQVTSKLFKSDELFEICNTADAVRALNVIVEQGEGSKKDTRDAEGELAHYYKFKELWEGKEQDTGISLILAEEDIWNISFEETKKAVAQVEKKPTDTRVNRQGLMLLKDFNACYRSLLNGLHEVFNFDENSSTPRVSLSDTIGLMFDLKLKAERLCAMPIYHDDDSLHFAPTFEFVGKANTRGKSVANKSKQR